MLTRPPKFNGRGYIRPTSDSSFTAYRTEEGWQINNRRGEVILQASTYPELLVRFHIWWQENGYEDQRKREWGQF